MVAYLLRGLLTQLLILLPLATIARPVAAWGPEGHRVIAHIAQENLTSKAQRRVSLLLGSDVSMADVAVWADEVREQRPETGPWHYINIPPSATELDFERDCPNDDCATTQIRRFIAIVRLGVRSADERREAMKYLIHFVGDLHQPLHAGYGQDRGGNEIPVIYRGEEWNLHSLWDSALLPDMSGGAAAVAASLNARIIPEQKKAWSRGSLRDWTWESHLLAVRVAYGALPAGNPKRPGEDYLQQAKRLIEEQLAKAGIRLAAIINDMWSH